MFKVTNPLKGCMPESEVRSRGSKAWMILPLVIAAFVGRDVLAGVAVGTIFVLFLMYTIEQIPGFWTIAQNAWGRLFIGLGTSLALHKITAGAGGTIVITIATGWAGLLKVVVLTFEAKRLAREKAARAESVLRDMRNFERNPVQYVRAVPR